MSAPIPSRYLDRFWSKVDREPVGCWRWLGGTSPKGYGVFYNGKRGTPAHRFAYEVTVGAIPDGLQLDHLCRNRWCVNPDHLEPVTAKENNLRSHFPGSGVSRRDRTHCANGHPFAGENLRISPAGHRRCRTCQSASNRAHRSRHQAPTPPWSPRPITDAELTRVVAFYQRHIDNNPIRALGAFGYTRNAASRRVRKARSLGMLPPTVPGKAKA